MKQETKDHFTSEKWQSITAAVLLTGLILYALSQLNIL